MCSGGMSTAEKYRKFGAGEYSSSDFARYVDNDAGLSASWKKIEANPNAPDSQYWIKKGATSKSAFGRAHAAEDAALYSGSYGDRGDTKIIKGTPEYDAYFSKYGGGTRFDAFNRGDRSSGSGESGSSSGRGGLLDSDIGPYPRPNKYFPLLTQAYDRPQARDYSEFIQAGNPFGGDGGLLYQPWSQQYSERYGLPNEIAQYQPNIFGVGPVSYYGAPFGPLNITPPEELFGNEEEDDDDDDGLNDPEGGGGDGGGVNGGYGGNASGAGVGNSGMGGYGGTGPASKGGSGKGKAGQSDHY
jgi:hypothetical protein